MCVLLIVFLLVIKGTFNRWELEYLLLKTITPPPQSVLDGAGGDDGSTV